jgi:hypothetical protein
MTRQIARVRVGERFEEIAAEDGRSASDLRLMQWLLRGATEAAVSGNGADERSSALPTVVDQTEREAVAAKRKSGRERHRAERGRALRPPRSFGRAEDRAGMWLRFAGVAVGLVAVAAAAVSYEAQWRLVYRDKHELDVSYIQAAIPDLGSLVFACFGIALALHGKRAIRARLLNLLCVGISITMNALAARPGWTGLAVWVMSPVIYALSSDTLIGVIRAYVIARQRQLHAVLAADGITLLQIVGAMVLWLLRLALAPPSTLKGFHAWVKGLPTAPLLRQPADDQRPKVTGPRPKAVIAPQRERPALASQRGPRGGTKQEQFLTLVIARYGPLTEFDIKAVARAAAELAPEAELHPGTARKILRAQVLAAQNGDPQ